MRLWIDQMKNKSNSAHILCGKIHIVLLATLFHMHVHVVGVRAELACHQCRGINCLRTSYVATQDCLSDVDICVNVFDGQTLLAQGCWEQLPEELRSKCDNGKQMRVSGESGSCFKCNENLCNTLSSSSFECIQCDSNANDSCRSNPSSLLPARCGISWTPNEYCFVKQEGQRVTRGCSTTLTEQVSCLNSDSCMICQPSQLSGCNNVEVAPDDGGSGKTNTIDGTSGNDSGSASSQTCFQCSGINCLRTSYDAKEKCLNDLDICATVFDGQTVLAQGCWEQLSEEMRTKCERDGDCVKCNKNLCNNLASSSFQCIQCNSDSDENCRTKPLSLLPSQCGISRTPNEYCFVKTDGKRVSRGCSLTLEEQMSCSASDNCLICQPSELSACNSVEVATEDGGSDSSSSGNEGSASGSGGGSAGNGSGSGGGSDHNDSEGEKTETNGSGNNSGNNGSGNNSSANNGFGNDSEGGSAGTGSAGNNGSGGSASEDPSSGGANTDSNGSATGGGGGGDDGSGSEDGGSESTSNGVGICVKGTYIFVTIIVGAFFKPFF